MERGWRLGVRRLNPGGSRPACTGLWAGGLGMRLPKMSYKVLWGADGPQCLTRIQGSF